MAIKWPTAIKVGYKTYTVNTDPNAHKGWEGKELENTTIGLTMAGEKVFSFKTDDVFDDEIMRETLIHELLHAALDIVHIQMDDDEEERIVGALSKTLFGIFKDNPGLATVIFGK